MAIPPPSTTTSASRNITPLTIYLLSLSLVTAVVISTAFYLTFGLTGAIIIVVLYIFSLGCAFVCKHVVHLVFYPNYDMLSERRKGEVDDVRMRGLKRLMEGFTFTLEKEHMMQESTSTIALTATGSSVSSSSSSLEHFNSSLLECSEDEEYDVELGNNVTSHSVAAKSSSNDENDGLGQNDAVTSTPSCEHDIVLNLYKKEDYACASSDVPTSSSSLVATSESAMMSSTLPSASESAHHNSVQLSCPATEVIEGPSNDDTTDEPTTLTSNEEEDRAAISNTTPRRREVPITDCSICRSSYEPSESICYSSNPRCPHVFHSDCMIQWLIALGRRNDEIVIGHGKKLREGHLLDYTLSCPCCRQPFFVQSSEILRKSDVDEEKHVLDSNDSVSEVGTHVDEMEEGVVEQGNASVVFTLPQ